MKRIFLFLCAGALLSSCSEETTSGVSRVTNYPTFEVVGGGDVIFVHEGDAFTDPGVIATEGGVEIPYTTTVTGAFQGGTTLDTSVPDIYTVTYTAVNQDGFSGSATRTVIVAGTGDLTTDISGLYTSSVIRNNVNIPQYQNLEYVLIWKNPDGTFQMSDGIGGYYAIGRGYGNGYAAGPMIITANDIATNNFSIPDYTVGTFGGVVHNTDFTVNAENDTIHFVSVWDSGYTFDVTLHQVQF